MMLFPITELLDEERCYEYLLDLLHPEGLSCPCGTTLPVEQAPHDWKRAPVVKYKCRSCGKVFHLFTNTILSGTHYPCSTLVMILRGIVRGDSTLHISQELDIDYGTLLKRRHALMSLAFLNQQSTQLNDTEVESDEMFQNAGEKGDPHLEEDDPPRRRANKRKGKGTFFNDRPPILGSVGRESGEVRLIVCHDTKQSTIQPEVEKKH
jgi:transposase-like protein